MPARTTSATLWPTAMDDLDCAIRRLLPLVAADTLRRDLVGNIVSYVVNRNINFTNICFVGCKFCAFSRGPREADSYFHSLEDMGRKSQRSVGPGSYRSLHPGRAAARSASFLLSRHSARRERRGPANAHSRFFSDGNCVWRGTDWHAVARLSD